jgi:glycosyltransferase involved in cell wall biosynthesis
MQVKPDVIHAHNWLLHSFLPLKRRSHAPLAVTLHDFSLICPKKSMMHAGLPCTGPGWGKCLGCAKEHYGAIKGGVTTLAAWTSSAYELRRVDKFLAVSRAVAEGNGLARLGAAFEVVPNFVPDDVAVLSAKRDSLLDVLPAEEYILFVGDLNRLKGAHVVLEAYARLRAAPPLVMIGRRCEDTPGEIPANVHIHHSWPHAAIMHAWSRCMLGVAPSTWADPCPTVVMEATACGKPMIATTIGGSPDLVDDGQTGILTPPGDAAALAAAMQQLIDEPDLRQRMAQAGLRKVETLKACAVTPRIERIYENLIAARGICATEEPRHAA